MEKRNNKLSKIILITALSLTACMGLSNSCLVWDDFYFSTETEAVQPWQIQIEVEEGGIDYYPIQVVNAADLTINWGDGSISNIVATSGFYETCSHDYSSSGVYIISISGETEYIRFGNSSSTYPMLKKLLTIIQG
jgi:hypothetical protein